MDWQDITTAPENTLLLGLRKHYTPGRRTPPVIVGVFYELAHNALIDQDGRWSECTHWAELPPLETASDSPPAWLSEVRPETSAYPLSPGHPQSDGRIRAVMAKLERHELERS